MPSGFAAKERLASGGRLYSRGRGIWRDKALLTAMPGAPEGATVSLLHNGIDDQGEVDSIGIRYRYPQTNQRGADAGDVEATKYAGAFDLPIFVITTERGTTNRRNIRLGWVAGADDDARVFDIRFDHPDGQPGDWVSGDARTQFNAIHRSARSCAVCNPSDVGRLHVVPLDPPAQRGDEVFSELALCSHHSQMFARGMFSIDPTTTNVVPRSDLTLAGMTIGRSDLTHLFALATT